MTQIMRSARCISSTLGIFGKDLMRERVHQRVWVQEAAQTKRYFTDDNIAIGTVTPLTVDTGNNCCERRAGKRNRTKRKR